MAKGSRKLYIGILGVAGTALLVDRFVLGQPAGAKAATPANEPLAVDPASRSTPAASGTTRTAAARIAAFEARSGNATGDLGAVPAWLKPVDAPAATPQAAAVKPWNQRYQITGYTRGARSGVTISPLDATGRDIFLMVGGTVDGMTLTAVDVESGEAVMTPASGTGKPVRVPIKVLQRKPASENGAAPR